MQMGIPVTTCICHGRQQAIHFCQLGRVGVISSGLVDIISKGREISMRLEEKPVRTMARLLSYSATVKPIYTTRCGRATSV